MNVKKENIIDDSNQAYFIKKAECGVQEGALATRNSGDPEGYFDASTYKFVLQANLEVGDYGEKASIK